MTTDQITDSGLGPTGAGGFPVTRVKSADSPVLDLYLHVDKATTTLANDLAVDAVQFDLAPGHGAVTGDQIDIQEGARVYQALITNVALNTIDVDTPIDFAFTAAGASVEIADHDLLQNGSVTPVIANLGPQGTSKWKITRVMFHIESSTAQDTSLFGADAALTKGCVLRVKNGETYNIFNVKSNGEFAERAYDVEYDLKAPAGSFGFRCRRTFGSDGKNGTTITLDPATNDEIQLIIQDNLTGGNNDHFHAVIQGTIVEE
jgi:hypothetical protein